MSLPITETSTAFEAEGLRIPAVIAERHDGSRPAWSIVLIPGSGPFDVDGNVPSRSRAQHAYADLARQLASRGVIALRFAKPGDGTGTVTLDPDAARVARTSFASRVPVAAAALETLRRLRRTARVALAGHSEGAIVASLLARQTPVDALVSLSGPSRRLLENIRTQLAVRTAAERDRALARMRDEADLRAYLLDADAVDPLASFAEVRVPSLIVQGGRDNIVTLADAERLAAARLSNGVPTEIAVFPDLTHMYKRAEAAIGPNDEGLLDGECDPAVANAIAEWLSRL